MTDTLCLSQTIVMFHKALDAPGVLAGRQRGGEFKKLVIQAGEAIIRIHFHAVRKIADINRKAGLSGENRHRHLLPFARRGVAAWLKLSASTCGRIRAVLEKIGLLADPSELTRWVEAGQPPSEGNKPYYFKPTIFRLGAEFEAAIVGEDGTELAVLSRESQCGPENTSLRFRIESEKDSPESLAPPVRSALAVKPAKPPADEEPDPQILAALRGREFKPSPLLLASLQQRGQTRLW